MSNMCLGLLHQVANRVATWNFSGNRNGIEDALALQEYRIHLLQMPAVCFGEEKVDDYQVLARAIITRIGRRTRQSQKEVDGGIDNVVFVL